MTMMTNLFKAALVTVFGLLLTYVPVRAQTPSPAQKPGRRYLVVPVDNFENGINGWLVKKAEKAGVVDDTDARLAITTDAAQIKEGKAALRYEYPVTPSVAPILALTRHFDLRGMKTAHFWMKVSQPTVLVWGLSDNAHHSFQTSFYCPAGSWQEIVLRLGELSPSTDPQNSPGALDYGQIESFYMVDFAGGLATIDPTLTGKRRLLLDDFSFSAEDAPRTTGKGRTVAGMPTYDIDNFETNLIRWIPVSLKADPTLTLSLVAPDATLKIDNHTLAYTYTRRDKTAQGILRNVEQIDLTGATDISMRFHYLLGGNYLLSVEKKNGARYERPIKIIASDGWKTLTVPLSSFVLSGDSQDPDGKLEAKDLKQISLTDITPMGKNPNGKTGQNTLYLDDVQFLFGTNGTDL